MIVKQTKSKKLAIIITTLVILILAGIILYSYIKLQQQNLASDSLHYDGATSEQKQQGDAAKSASIGADDASKPNTTATGSDSASPTAGTVQVTIPSAQQTNDTVRITTSIGAITSDGTCTITIQNGSRTHSESVAVQPLASTSTCKGFTVPVLNLGTGTWTITLEYTSSSLSGKATSTVEVGQ